MALQMSGKEQALQTGAQPTCQTSCRILSATTRSGHETDVQKGDCTSLCSPLSCCQVRAYLLQHFDRKSPKCWAFLKMRKKALKGRALALDRHEGLHEHSL